MEGLNLTNRYSWRENKKTPPIGAIHLSEISESLIFSVFMIILLKPIGVNNPE